MVAGKDVETTGKDKYLPKSRTYVGTVSLRSAGRLYSVCVCCSTTTWVNDVCVDSARDNYHNHFRRRNSSRNGKIIIIIIILHKKARCIFV